MLHPAKRLGNSSKISTPTKHLRMSAGALVCALAVLPMSALALCDDSLLCTAIGTGALALNTTGESNTASGNSALFSNTTGSFNAASGSFALFSNTTGENNTASGWFALHDNTSGSFNTANGGGALSSNTTGHDNTASGVAALVSNTTGNFNTASGRSALYFNTTGSFNTASGRRALVSNTKGLRNVAVGTAALMKNTTGSDNIALGNNASSIPVTGVNNIHIGHAGVAGETKVIRLGRQGTQLRTFIAGIRGATVSGAAVVVSSTGQLGVVSSSRRYKENIQPMADASAALMKLKPVTFRYKEADEQGKKPMQFGLIAEEVAEVLPELVVRDDKGHPETVAYHVLPSLLLNEYQKQQAELAQFRDALAARDKELAAMHAEMKALRQVTQQLMAAIDRKSVV